MAKKNGLDQKEQLMAAAIMCGFGLMYQVSSQLKNHMEDCRTSSERVAKIGYGILVIVVAGLILSAVNSYHSNGDTTQRITTVEEKRSK